ncbi:Zn-ribbon domain-containing OB-fold protein [Metallosphaera tengchongensis]|uniref:Zn-ribbon domain-containing OB-fold protein n=1 Tax=Metallosphaera tengchongensis TaxID=1532350 RepID=A0A6N0NTS4_9CREN|nr:Zn-ribbon domain-containing OB-fold protein [Metallosphaera tengchongensis]QKQ99302.1 Zn-ribbon domain-containing OB-fold protein [Metallosphaera tengchongensis]
MRILPPKIWRNKDTHYALSASVCEKCGNVIFPARASCNKCGSFKVKLVKLSGKGTLLSFTKSHQIRTGYEKESPVYFGLIRLDEGIEILAPLVDVDDDPKDGSRVEATIRRLRVDSSNGLIEYGTKFRLIENE